MLTVHVVAVTARAAQAARDQGVQDHRVADGHVRHRGPDLRHPSSVLVSDRVGQVDLRLGCPLRLTSVVSSPYSATMSSGIWKSTNASISHRGARSRSRWRTAACPRRSSQQLTRHRGEVAGTRVDERHAFNVDDVSEPELHRRARRVPRLEDFLLNRRATCRNPTCKGDWPWHVHGCSPREPPLSPPPSRSTLVSRLKNASPVLHKTSAHHL